MITITATEFRKHLGFYLQAVQDGKTLAITKNGREICELHPSIPAKLALFDSLCGIAKGIDPDQAREERVYRR
ncbi:MAG: type II toxin-antitoxin system Phd/YefM family antitoxin [Bacilli bacterium]|nr:type II toxin-antitoxin system Phd/YefM family antitoxin [Bacilli bacterium]